MNTKIVDLSDSRIKVNPYEKSFKLVTCESISLSLQAADVIPIITNLPFSIKIALTLDLETNEYKFISLDAIIDEIKFCCNELSWQLLVTLFMTLKKCLERDIPPPEPAASPRSSKEKKKPELPPPPPNEVEFDHLTFFIIIYISSQIISCFHSHCGKK